MDGQWADLVLEGGGVKGIGLIGAIEQLNKADYKFRRVAGTSAGAIVGSLVAAGMPVKTMLEVMRELDYKKFRDESFIDKLGIGGKSASLYFEQGIYEGNYLKEWLAGQLDKLGVRTFADLKITEAWAKDIPPEQRYKLVVVASDISGGRLARLPWDYKRYGLDPDKQLVADAVRASMSIPFFYEPVRLGGKIMVDGGMLSNFPIGLFDSTPDWPTFGIKLSAQPDANMVTHEIKSTFDLAKAMLATMINAHDQMHIDDPCTAARTIFVDTLKIKATNFDITAEEQQKLFANGQKAAKQFLDTWDFKKWRKMCS
jgi:NTE family protein